MLWGTLALALLVSTASALNNGLALTPPMGWMSWQRFRCVTDCKSFPNECINEQLYREQADKMVEDGYLAAGYEYIILDDCWMAKERDENGRLIGDPERFPSGMKNLSDYFHSKGLKFGIYEDFGTYTCGGYPGSIDHLEEDARTFAEWEVDYVKLDGCYADPDIMDNGYPEFGRYLKATNRSIVYSCSWPVYQDEVGIDPNLDLIAQHCNLWRNYDDIQDSWASVTNIVDWYVEKQDAILPKAGPGKWNDPDMLIIGNYGLSYEQSKSQMAIWAAMAAPLIMSNDLRDIKQELKDILLNKDIIAINQDKLGLPGRQIYDENDIQIWIKPIQPVVDGANSFAIAAVSRRDDGAPRPVQVSLARLRVKGANSYSVSELFSGVGPIEIANDGILSFRLPPSGAKIFRAVASTKKVSEPKIKEEVKPPRAKETHVRPGQPEKKITSPLLRRDQYNVVRPYNDAYNF